MVMPAARKGPVADVTEGQPDPRAPQQTANPPTPLHDIPGKTLPA